MLYIVGTPIGNLGELSFRAVEVLKSVDYIACEDTRNSITLLKHYEINKPLVAYHKFNEKSMLSKFIDDLNEGKDIALISDAGMPVISDPGNVLVNAVIENDLPYTVVSGPSAFVNAFILSGYSSPFTFVGFLPNKVGESKKLLQSLNTNTTLIFYLAPHDIDETFKLMLNVFGNREVCVVRELTKKFEQVTFTTLEKGYDGVKKGEFVLLIKPQEQTNPLNELTIKEHFEVLLNQGLNKNDAIKTVAHERKIKKDVVYKEVNNI